jgi:hypothetical protein
MRAAPLSLRNLILLVTNFSAPLTRAVEIYLVTRRSAKPVGSGPFVGRPFFKKNSAPSKRGQTVSAKRTRGEAMPRARGCRYDACCAPADRGRLLRSLAFVDSGLHFWGDRRGAAWCEMAKQSTGSTPEQSGAPPGSHRALCSNKPARNSLMFSTRACARARVVIVSHLSVTCWHQPDDRDDIAVRQSL